jgi:hypothetical protein
MRTVDQITAASLVEAERVSKAGEASPMPELDGSPATAQFHPDTIYHDLREMSRSERQALKAEIDSDAGVLWDLVRGNTSPIYDNDREQFATGELANPETDAPEWEIDEEDRELEINHTIKWTIQDSPEEAALYRYHGGDVATMQSHEPQMERFSSEAILDAEMVEYVQLRKAGSGTAWRECYLVSRIIELVDEISELEEAAAEFRYEEYDEEIGLTVVVPDPRLDDALDELVAPLLAEVNQLTAEWESWAPARVAELPKGSYRDREAVEQLKAEQFRQDRDAILRAAAITTAKRPKPSEHRYGGKVIKPLIKAKPKVEFAPPKPRDLAAEKRGRDRDLWAKMQVEWGSRLPHWVVADELESWMRLMPEGRAHWHALYREAFELFRQAWKAEQERLNAAYAKDGQVVGRRLIQRPDRRS